MQPRALESVTRSERGVAFRTEDAFFRSESGLSRDLGCLALAVRVRERAQERAPVRVLEAFAGSGSRGVRYASHLPAGSHLWSNDVDASLGPTLARNLAGRGNVQVTHEDAKALLCGCFARGDKFTLVDLDGFGSSGVATCGVACCVTEDEGLVYVAGTDAATVAGGHNAGKAFGSYGGSFCATKLPFASEQGMRVVVYAAVQAAAAQGRDVAPVFCHYSGHGPVFRAMLRVRRGRPGPTGGMVGSVGYMRHCRACGNSASADAAELGGQCFAVCPECKAEGTSHVAGPLWTGDLHDRAFLARMREEAEDLGWVSCDGGDSSVLGGALEVMEEEAALKGVAFHIPLDLIAARARLRGTPPRDALLAALPFPSCRTSFDTKAIRCGAPIDAIAEAWREAGPPREG